mmetsp:Transcript_29099/g.86171  ORF Transcript_29099/g.86171 Transcript_29099/m.86171 type:complete len:273 (-) Transcript_29099:142-960(-)
MHSGQKKSSSFFQCPVWPMETKPQPGSKAADGRRQRHHLLDKNVDAHTHASTPCHSAFFRRFAAGPAPSSPSSSAVNFCAAFARSSSRPPSSCAYSTTRRRPYRCVPPTPSIAFFASCLVTNSTNAKPRWLPSNFLGSRQLLRWPNGEKMPEMSLRVASNATLRTTSLADVPSPLAFLVALLAPPAAAFTRLSCRESLCLSSMEPCSALMTALATSSLSTSTKPKPIDRGWPSGPFLRATRALRSVPPAAETVRSKCFCRSASDVAHARFLT